LVLRIALIIKNFQIVQDLLKHEVTLAEDILSTAFEFKASELVKKIQSACLIIDETTMKYAISFINFFNSQKLILSGHIVKATTEFPELFKNIYDYSRLR
jgi:hypothetical protein